MSFSILPAVGSGGIVGFMFGLLGGRGSILATPTTCCRRRATSYRYSYRRASAAFSGPCQGRSKIWPLNMAMAAYFSNYPSCEVRPQ